MTSIIDRRSIDSQPIHNCGGTVLMGPDTEDGRQYYCGQCAAFRYGHDDLPSGTDREANRAAFDAGDLESPEAE